MSDILNLLPVGSVVYLKGGEVPLLIISVGVIANPKKPAKPIFFDYYGTLSPGGITKDTLYFFNHSHIDRVVFRGMDSEEFVKYLKKTDKQIQKLLKRGRVELWTRD